MKPLIILPVLLLSFAHAFASDIKVTAQAAVHPNNNGELLIEINPALGNAPFDINISGLGGYQYNQQILGYSLLRTNLKAGNYCVQVVSDDGCVGNVCVEVMACRYIALHDTYLCTPSIEPCCPGHIVVTGTPMQPLTGDETESDFLYAWHVGVDSATLVSLANGIIDSTFNWVYQILAYGSTEHDVTSPYGIDDPDIVFALGYDSTGTIQWIWHDLYDDRLLLNIEQHSSFEWIIFPNPGRGMFTIKWQSYSSIVGLANIEYNVYNHLGKSVYKGSIMNTSFDESILDLQALTPGVYILSLFVNDFPLESRLLNIY